MAGTKSRKTGLAAATRAFKDPAQHHAVRSSRDVGVRAAECGLWRQPCHFSSLLRCLCRGRRARLAANRRSNAARRAAPRAACRGRCRIHGGEGRGGAGRRWSQILLHCDGSRRHVGEQLRDNHEGLQEERAVSGFPQGGCKHACVLVCTCLARMRTYVYAHECGYI